MSWRVLCMGQSHLRRMMMAPLHNVTTASVCSPVVSPALQLQKHRCHRHGRAHSHHPLQHRPLRVGLMRCRRSPCFRCRMQPLLTSPSPHEATAGRAQPQPLQTPPPSRPSAACKPSCGRPPPSSSAPAGAPAGIVQEAWRVDKDDAFQGDLAANQTKPGHSRAAGQS